MTKEEFQELLVRYQKEECTSEERRYVEKWIEAVQNNAPSFTIDEAGKEIQLREQIMGVVQPEREGEANIFELAGADGAIAPVFKWGNLWKERSFKHWHWVAAAIVIISCGLFLMKDSFLNNARPVRNLAAAAEFFENAIVNNRQDAMEINLGDGSLICLESGGKIAVAPDFNKAKERIVRLEGTAFFKAARDAKRPFIVVTKNLVTKVLGTSFTIHAEKGKEESVAVKTGKVAVYSTAANVGKSPDSFATITPNHEVRYDEAEQRLITSIVKQPMEIYRLEKSAAAADEPSPPPSADFRMKFKEVSPVEIFNALQTAYGIKIIYDEKAIAGCVLTASLKDEDFYTRLQTVCDLIGGEYRINENEVAVTGPGCK